MAPHLDAQEQDLVYGLFQKGKTTNEILARITAKRERQGQDAPKLQAITRAVRGRTYKRGRKETRGRKAKWSTANVRKVNSVRKRLLKKAKGEGEVHWKDVIKKARVPTTDASTARRSLERAGISVQARRPREKPIRDDDVKEERVVICKKWKKKPRRFFTRDTDIIIDNKKFETPLSQAGKKYKRMRRVRFHLRTREEGLQPECTKPSARKNRVNPGGSLNVCAGIINNRIKLWHYIKAKRWNGAVAAALYRGPIIRALRRYRGRKHSFRILEDNDPTGYKSGKAKTAKRELKILPEAWPRYSPDLNPLDFSIWDEVERRMAKQKDPVRETVAKYKARLRRTAMNIPTEVIKKAVASIPERAATVVLAGGGDIPRD